MVQISKVGKNFKRKNDPLLDALYNKIKDSVNVNKYMKNNNINIKDFNPDSLEVKSLSDILQYLKMGVNNYENDLAEFIKDPSSINELLNVIKGNKVKNKNLDRLDQAKAGTSAGVGVTGALLSLLMDEDEQNIY